MATFERSVVVEAPRVWLFDVMQDYARRLEWDEFLEEARLVGGASAAALGVRALCVDRAGRGMETEYVAFRRPERVAVRMTRGPWVVSHFAGSWIYRSLGSTSTEVRFRYSLRARLLGRLGDALLARLFARQMTRRLLSAKQRLEALRARDERVAL